MNPSLYLDLLAFNVLLQRVLADGGADGLPTFVSPIENVTVSVGRDARLTCVVENLDNYQVAWIYKGTGGRTVLTVASKVITKNPRISTAQEAQASVLTVTDVGRKDEGVYMCQVNTKPVRKQLGYLRVVVPPRIDDATSSSDVTVSEGSDVSMTCDARGDPPPVVRWIREDGRRFATNSSSNVEEYLGRVLPIPSAGDNSTGAYLCIASNGYPPTVSKRIILTVNFPPRMVRGADSGRVGVAPEGVVTLTCRFRARPLAEVTWYRGPREVKPRGQAVKIDTKHFEESGLWSSVLSVHVERERDFGQYRCFVRNHLGSDEKTFNVVEITTTTTTTTTTTSTTTTSTSTTSTSKLLPNKASSTQRPGLHLHSTQPPFFPWWSTSATETTTPANQKNRFVQNGGDGENDGSSSSNDQKRKTSLTFGSFFDHPTSTATSFPVASRTSSTCVAVAVSLYVVGAAATS